MDSNKYVQIYIITTTKWESHLRQAAEHRGDCSVKLTSRLTSLTGGNFFLHSMDRDRRSVCMFSSNFFTASGLLVDIFDGAFDKNLKKLQTIRNVGAQSPPTTHPQREYIPSLLYLPPLQKKIKTPRSIDTLSHFSAMSGDDTGICSPCSKHGDISFVK